MPRDRDNDSASSTSGQSKRPALSHHESDTQSDTSGLQQHQHHHRRHHHHQKQHHVSRHHAHVRAPVVAKVGHKAPKLSRRHTSPPPDSEAGPPSAVGGPSSSNSNSHRRAASDAKLSSRESSSANLHKSSSHSKLKRNRSHVEIGKRNRSTDKLKRTASNTVVYSSVKHSSKHQVHFDLGTDNGQEDEWVDASGSNSPYLSRKTSVNSGQSSVRHGATASASGSRPVTPNEPVQPVQPPVLLLPPIRAPEPEQPSDPEAPPQEQQRDQHKEHLTNRILKRVPSQGAPPKMTTDAAEVAPPRRFSPASGEEQDPAMLVGSGRDELTSRFVAASGSGVTSEGSFYRQNQGDFPQYQDGIQSQRPRSVISLPPPRDDSPSAPDGVDDTALVPKTAWRALAPTAEISRTQQKLNLQRASSVLEPGQPMGGVGEPPMRFGGRLYDAGHSRDPRVNKMIERTGMEYMVVRRYQNSVARSLNRISQLPGMEKTRRIPQYNSSTVNGKRIAELPLRHTRNVSMPDPRRPAMPKRPTSLRTNGAASSYEGDDDARLAERLSGSSLVGGQDEDGTAALLRNLWEKSMELGTSAD